MENVLLQISSPTLLVAMKEAHTKHINEACRLFRAIRNKQVATITLAASFTGLENPLVIASSEIPFEFADALHNYATRLIGERWLIENRLNKINAEA